MAVGLVFLGSYLVESGVCGLPVVVPKRLDFLSTGIGTISDDLMWACIMKLHQSSTWALGLLSDSKPPELEFCSYPD